MKDRGFKKPIIYWAEYFWRTNIGDAGQELWDEAKLWLARYDNNDGQIPPDEECYTKIPKGSRYASIWQFTDQGKFDGVPEGKTIDWDLLHKDLL